MGRKDKILGGNLGKSLIRDRFGPRKTREKAGDPSMFHTAEINDGYDWGRLNLQSVTEESSFQEFLSTAELAGTEFHAEKLNIKYVNPKSGIGLLSKDERDKVLETHEKHKALLKIPRRPQWVATTTAHELQMLEKEKFLEWRRSLALLQEAEEVMLTPYEKNLEFWRQLWRVVERSDVVIQIVDARNPLLFRCQDLEKYVKEVSTKKMNMILINKADFLTEVQRQGWAKYFSDINVRVVFFSAALAAEKQKTTESIHEEEAVEEEEEVEEEEDVERPESGNEEEPINENEADEESMYSTQFASGSEYESADDGYGNDDGERDFQHFCNNLEDPVKQENDGYQLHELKDSVQEICDGSVEKQNIHIQNSPEVLTREKLVALFKTIYNDETYTKEVTTIGLVGYPNVGKSSTINALLMDKKVSVSATPGKTKHFQTLFLDKDLVLCDCPGLVMPSFVCTKAEMILNGILPIDQMRDHVPPITLLGTLIPKHIIEDLYGIMLVAPLEGEDPDRPPTAEEILNAYGYNRGFMTQNGQPDNPRSARYVLKDYVNGKLLYCVSPPTIQQEMFHTFPPRRRIISENKHLPARTIRVNRGSNITTDDLDKAFFASKTPGVHVRGVLGKTHGVPQRLSSTDSGSVIGSTQTLLHEEKPWKKMNKHNNKKKREKTRRLYAHLDQH